MSKLITVYGATGIQGGSVVRALLRDNSGLFKIRGITRNPSSEVAKSLAASGAVEVVKADGFFKEELVEAFRGSWAVFVNTNSDDPAFEVDGAPSETELGKTIVDAAVEAGVQVFVYSGLSSATQITNGAVPNLSFDEKYAIGQYANLQPSLTTIIVSPGWYLENFLSQELAPVFGGLPFIQDAQGYYTFSWPYWGGKNEVPLIAIERDFGDIVHGVLLAPERWAGKTVQGISQSKVLDEFGTDFEKATGKKARFVPVENWRDLETYGYKSLETVKNMFGLCQHSGGLYYGVPNDVKPAAELKALSGRAQGKEGDELLLTSLEDFYKTNFA